jgi:hypothetical protein
MAGTQSTSTTVPAVLFRRDPVAVVGVLLSVTLSIALDVTNAASGVESLLAGLAGTTLALMLDSIVRAERRFQLRRAVESAPWFGDVVYALADSAQEIERAYRDTHIITEARNRFQRLREDLADLSRGRIERDGSDYHYLLEPSLHVQHRIDAVTNIGPESGRLGWWDERIGQRYWRANLDAIARGVRITRIFTYDVMTPTLERIVDEQRRAGVIAYALPRDMVSESLQMNFVIWDNNEAWEARLNARGTIVANIYTLNQHDLVRLRTAFQRLLVIAARENE